MKRAGRTRSACLLFGLGLAAVVYADGPLEIGGRKQLFIDGRFIDRMENVALTPNPPCKHEAVTPIGPLLDLPENLELDYGSTFFDPLAPPGQRYKRLALRGHMRERDTAGIFVDTSPDRKTWTEGTERVFPFWPDGEVSMMYDPRLGTYVAYFRQWIPHPDWPFLSTYQDAPVTPLRTVGRLEVPDPLEPWPLPETEQRFHLWGTNNLPAPGPEFEVALAPDADDPPGDFYDQGIVRYPWADEVYLAFPTFYRHFPDPPGVRPKPNDGLCDVQLAVSRDGRNWTRFRLSYIRLGPRDQGAPDAGVIYYMNWLLRHGDKIYQYYMAAPKSHGTSFGSEELGNPRFWGMVKQRLDGFVSADAAYTGGELVTPPLLFEGERLELNIDTSASGDARVELLDAEENPLPGYTLADADMIQGNYIRKTVTWQGNQDVSPLAGRPVRLRFVMRSAKLYAFQFQPGESP